MIDMIQLNYSFGKHVIFDALKQLQIGLLQIFGLVCMKRIFWSFFNHFLLLFYSLILQFLFMMNILVVVFF